MLLWLGVGLSLAHWGWRWWGQTPPEPVPLVAAQRLAVETDGVARGLGVSSTATLATATAPAATASNHVLLGVVRDRNGAGLALIATNGQPAKAYRVGAAVADGVWLGALGARDATLVAQPGGSAVTRLSLPLPPR